MLFWWPLESEDQIYIVLCWNALAKLQNARIASHHPALVGNCPTFSHVPWTYQSTKWFFISMFHLVFGAWDSVVMREVPFEQKIYMKCMYVNALKNLAKMTRIPYVFGGFPKNRLWWKNRKASSVVYVNHHCRFVNASGNSMSQLREKCPDIDLFLVRIFLYSVRIQENMDQKQLRILTFFTQCQKSSSTRYIQICLPKFFSQIKQHYLFRVH